MAKLVKEGKVNYLGLSEVSAEDSRRPSHLCASTPLVFDIESSKTELLKTARELGTTIVAYSPLARGLITGQNLLIAPDDFEENYFRKTKYPKVCHHIKLKTSLAWHLAQG
ncbi:hypothetical protein BT96DRAFT_996517 [Gymnopus androsaceus JB14]|uniref:NADP-dependent oxidoreductase domain-containing protein n=1 Tax=Gymnopus androsaceus JB14 TaxID=1447944 RepID=A0A6A4HIB6_9AGAR|nr:hypothetical protein BT96DRAFT_996517 [Gymnopus androsaceus JB14]